MPALTLIASTGLGALCFIATIVALLSKPRHDLINNGAELDSFEAAFGDLIAWPIASQPRAD